MTPEKEKQLTETAQTFISLAKKKGYKSDTIKSAVILASSTYMHAVFGDTVTALNEAINLCSKYDKGSEFIAEYFALAGLGID